MGQLFDRFKDYLKSEIKYSEVEFHNEEDDLKKIIQELNNQKKESEQNSKSQQRENSKEETNSKMDLNKACEILEIPINADLETIQNSYRRLVKEYHPDKVNNMGKEIRLLAQKKTIEINQAYEYIKNINNI